MFLFPDLDVAVVTGPGAGRATSLDQEQPPLKKVRKSSQHPIASTSSKAEEIKKVVNSKDDPIPDKIGQDFGTEGTNVLSCLYSLQKKNLKGQFLPLGDKFYLLMSNPFDSLKTKLKSVV